MTTEKRPRNSKELTITDAVAKLRAVYAEHSKAVEEAVHAAAERVNRAYYDRGAKILDRVHPSARDLVMAEARKADGRDPVSTMIDAAYIEERADEADAERPAPDPDSEPLTPIIVADDSAGVREPIGFSQAIGAVADSLPTEEQIPVKTAFDDAEVSPLPKGVTEYVPGPAAKAAARGR